MKFSRSMSPFARFEAKHIAEPNTGCWLWVGQIEWTGYGRFWDGEYRVYAHRWSYEHNVGVIPEGMQLDHLCRERSCVNPKHLEPVTCKENINRGLTKNHTWTRGEKMGASKLTEHQVLAIRNDTRMYKEIAPEYGVSKSLIGMIKRRERWNHL